ncbi:hypothetical protein TNCV_3394351 [Trichonephila clavipes]|nr:hypothetical protein TNCV_3394351 [Trichonephila clavipes]
MFLRRDHLQKLEDEFTKTFQYFKRKKKPTFNLPSFPINVNIHKELKTLRLQLMDLQLVNLAVDKSWFRLLDGKRHVQLSALTRVEGVACFRIISGHGCLQAHLFKIGLADSPLCLLDKSWPMTGKHLSDCPTLLHVLSQDNCGALLPDRAASALYWTARRLMSERTLVGVI